MCSPVCMFYVAPTTTALSVNKRVSRRGTPLPEVSWVAIKPKKGLRGDGSYYPLYMLLGLHCETGPTPSPSPLPCSCVLCMSEKAHTAGGGANRKIIGEPVRGWRSPKISNIRCTSKIHHCCVDVLREMLQTCSKWTRGDRRSEE